MHGRVNILDIESESKRKVTIDIERDQAASGNVVAEGIYLTTICGFTCNVTYKLHKALYRKNKADAKVYETILQDVLDLNVHTFMFNKLESWFESSMDSSTATSLFRRPNEDFFYILRWNSRGMFENLVNSSIMQCASRKDNTGIGCN